MKDYLLFLDTETSDLPRRWDVPYSDKDNWPHTVQVAWLIYTRDGQLVKKENFFVSNDDFAVTPAAQRIHQIPREKRLAEGHSRWEILNCLAADLKQYHPLVVAHFMQLDYHMLGADFYRIGRDNPLDDLPIFCTMIASSRYVSNPRSKYLRLGRLYYVLFNRDLEHQHDALADAQATADCFFEMHRLGHLDEAQIQEQQIPLRAAGTATSRPSGGCAIPILAFFILTAIISYWL